MKIKTSLISVLLIGGAGYYLSNKKSIDSQLVDLKKELNLNLDNLKDVLLASKKLQASVRNFSEILNDNQDSIVEFIDLLNDFSDLFSKNS